MATELNYKRWMKLDEAAEYSSIGQHRLKLLASQGKIKGCQDPDSKRRDWVFDRLSIDSYRESQMNQLTLKEEALAIMSGVKI